MLLLGRASELRGDYNQALNAYEQQLRIAEGIGDRSQLAYSHVYLGSFLVYKERYNEALGHFEESYALNNALGAKPRLGYDLMNQANVLWQIGQYGEARHAFDQAHSYAQQSAKNPQLMAWILLFQARMELSELRSLRALSLAQGALSLAGSEYKDVMIQAKSSLGLAQAMSGMLSAALRSCSEALALAKETDDPRLIANCELALSKVLIANGHHQNALTTALAAQEFFLELICVSHNGRHGLSRLWRHASFAIKAGLVITQRKLSSDSLSFASSGGKKSLRNIFAGRMFNCIGSN